MYVVSSHLSYNQKTLHNEQVQCDFCSRVYHESCLPSYDRHAHRMWSCKKCKLNRAKLDMSESKVWKFPRYDTSRCKSSPFELPRCFLNHRIHVASDKIRRVDFSLPAAMISNFSGEDSKNSISPAQKKKKKKKRVLSSSCIVGKRNRRSTRRRLVNKS